MWVLLILERIKLYVQITESCLSLLKWELFFNNAKRKQCFPLNQRKKEVPWFPEVLLSLSLWAVNFIQSINNLFRLGLCFPSPPALLSCTLVIGKGRFGCWAQRGPRSQSAGASAAGPGFSWATAGTSIQALRLSF